MNSYVEIQLLGKKNLPAADREIIRESKNKTMHLCYNPNSFLLDGRFLPHIVNRLNHLFKEKHDKYSDLSIESIKNGDWCVQFIQPIKDLNFLFPDCNFEPLEQLYGDTDLGAFIEIKCDLMLDTDDVITLRLESIVPENVANLIVGVRKISGFTVPLTVDTLLGHQVSFANINVIFQDIVEEKNVEKGLHNYIQKLELEKNDYKKQINDLQNQIKEMEKHVKQQNANTQRDKFAEQEKNFRYGNQNHILGGFNADYNLNSKSTEKVDIKETKKTQEQFEKEKQVQNEIEQGMEKFAKFLFPFVNQENIDKLNNEVQNAHVVFTGCKNTDELRRKMEEILKNRS